MDIDINSGNNSIDSLSFYWIAEFTDDCIFQFENGVEHRFQEVINKFNDLKYFTLQHKEKDLNFTVDLILGIISFNTEYKIRELKKEKKNIRLIYFRRHTVTLTELGKEKEHTIMYHLGFQYNENEINRQIVLEIDSDGNFIITGE
jgi:hypothetical protein